VGNSVARTVGRYEILDELGSGGMATVFLARQTDLDRLVALKELSALRQSDPSFARRFLRESRLAGSLSHPNIVTVHDYFESDGIPYIAMEYVPRGSLRPQIGHLSLAQVAGVLEGMLSALAHAEQHNIVHRDLKPENVLVTSEGRVKVTDFGIAKATGRLQTTSVLTAAGSTVGTPNYIAPEQAMGREVGPWTDLYSLGVMAFELFVGQVPFYDTEEPMAILMRQVSDPIPPARSLNPEVDPAISDWIEGLLVKKPEDRVQTAGEAWDPFEEIVIDLVGPRWRRAAPLLAPAERPTDAPAGPATPPPTTAARPPLMPTWEIPNWGPSSEAPTRPLRDRDEAALARTVMPEEPTRRLDEDDAPPKRGSRLLRAALFLVVLVVVLAAAFGGRGSSPGGPPVAAPASTVGGPDMALRVPAGWRRVRAAPDVGLPLSRAVAAAPRGRRGAPMVEFGLVKGDAGANSALLPAAFLNSVGHSADSPPARTAVRLPDRDLQAWRYARLRPLGSGRELTVYTVPTSAGVATVACAAPASQCDAIAGTLRLRRATPYPIGASNTYASALNGTIGELEATTRPQEENLQSSQTLADQAAAAVALAHAYESAATQLASVDLSPADREANGKLVGALRGAAAAYRRAARTATRGDAGGYRAASAAIPAQIAQVNTALAGLHAAGYKPAAPAAPTQPEDGDAPATGSPAEPRSDVGDSRSDDPSDDSEDP
jgi:serine/threonine protein kinase